MLALALLLQASSPPAAPPPQIRGDIVVRGAREDDREARIRRIRRQVADILPPVGSQRPLARFDPGLCPGVAGLSPASAQAVVDRIGAIADTLALRVGEPGCDPNLLVIVTDDADAAIRRLVRRRTGLFPSQGLADLRRILAETGWARGWTTTEIRSRDGEPPVTGPGEVPVLDVATAGRIALPFRRDISSAVVVIDARAARGRDTRQIADYAAMRALTDARPDRTRGPASILSAFTPDDRGDTAAPPGLTALDLGILHGLYAGSGDQTSDLKIRDRARDRRRPGMTGPIWTQDG